MFQQLTRFSGLGRAARLAAVAAIAVQAGMFVATPAQAAIGYAITEIPPLAGNVTTVATGINSLGQVAFSSDGNVALWDNGTATLLAAGTVGPVNAAGQVAGISTAGILTIWQNGKAPISTGAAYVPSAINDKGEVVGTYRINLDVTRGFLWSNGKLSDLSAPATYYPSQAFGINNSSLIAGSCMSTAGPIAVTTWQGKRRIGYGAFGYDQAVGYAVNDKGQIAAAGLRWTDFVHHAFLFDPATRVVTKLPGSGDTLPVAVNNSGAIVGTQNGSPFLWSNGVLTPLSSLLPAGSGWQITGVTGINDLGWIAGNGTLNGAQRGFVLKPQ